MREQILLMQEQRYERERRERLDFVEVARRAHGPVPEGPPRLGREIDPEWLREVTTALGPAAVRQLYHQEPPRTFVHAPQPNRIEERRRHVEFSDGAQETGERWASNVTPPAAPGRM